MTNARFTILNYGLLLNMLLRYYSDQGECVLLCTEICLSGHVAIGDVA
jgi:hypothetical protein